MSIDALRRGGLRQALEMPDARGTPKFGTSAISTLFERYVIHLDVDAVDPPGAATGADDLPRLTTGLIQPYGCICADRPT
jgi:hypothetical protein